MVCRLPDERFTLRSMRIPAPWHAHPMAIDPLLASLADRMDLLEEEFRALRSSLAPPSATLRGLHLTRTEGVILDALLTGRVCGTEYLLDRLDAVLGGDNVRTPANLRVRMVWLRKKLAVLDPPIRIKNSRRDGYLLIDADELKKRLIQDQ